MAETIELGIVGIKNMGEYSQETAYEKLNVVSYQGSTYCALRDTVGNLPTNTDYWQLYAQKGDKGDIGETGPQGPKPVKGVDYYTSSDKQDIIDDVETYMQEQVDVLESRMDEFTNLAEGSTTGDAELADIRVAYNGITYNTAGDSVRNQATLVNQNKTTLMPLMFKNISSNIEWVNNERIGNDGTVITAATGWKRSRLIKIDSPYILFDYIYRFTSNLTYSYFFNFYSANETNTECFLGGANPSNAVASTECYANLMKIDVPSGARYFAISAVSADLTALTLYDTSFNIDLLKNESIIPTKIDDIYYNKNILTDTFEAGSITTDGNYNASTTYKITEELACKPSTKYYRKKSDSIALVGCYDSSHNWIRRLVINANTDNFTTPGHCFYIKYCDTNANCVGQMVSERQQDGYLPFNTSDIVVKDSELAQGIIKTQINLHNKNVCILGDSIAYGIGATDRTTDSWAALLASYTGANVTNLAISGASIQYRSGAESQAKSIHTVSTETDFTPYDYVIISGGTNDILSNIGEPTDSVRTTACGALNLIIQNILTSNPKCQIIFFGPMFRSRFQAGDGHNSDDYSYDGKWVIDLADKLQATCEKNHIPNKNLYRTFELNKYNANVLLNDGLHPNDLGHKRLSEIIRKFINTNI